MEDGTAYRCGVGLARMVNGRRNLKESSSGAGEIWGERDMKVELYKSFEDESNHEATLT
jgi:hypothetical protein